MDAKERLNQLKLRVVDLQEEMLYMLFVLSFNRKLTPGIQKIITEISHDLEGINVKKSK